MSGMPKPIPRQYKAAMDRAVLDLGNCAYRVLGIGGESCAKMTSFKTDNGEIEIIIKKREHAVAPTTERE